MSSGRRPPKRGSRVVAMGNRFFRQAEYDLDNARSLVRPHSSYLAANLAHQAAEKALKAAVWSLVGQEPPWKHSLRQLAELAVTDPSHIPAAVAAAIAVLNPIFEDTRYPSGDVADPIPADLISEATAQDAIGAAEEVMLWIHRLTGRPQSRER
jgi:HEPN domain-containing protein